MDWSYIITGAITFISGGGLVTLFTMKQSKEAKQIENASALVNEYRKLLDDYKEKVDKQNQRIEELTAKVNDLQMELASMNQKIAMHQVRAKSAELMKCEKINCQQRRPPIDKDNLDRFLNGEKEHDDEGK